MSFLKKHYEKVILAVLLVIFVLLLGFQILIILRARDVDIDSVVGVKPPRPDYPKIVPGDPAYDYEASLANKKGFWTLSKNKDDESDVCEAPPLTRCPFGPHLIPVTDFPKQNAKQTGKCSYCGKEIKVFVSTLYITEDDSDGDGIPDKWENQYGLNMKDPADAKLDMDEDGFTNLEEFQAKTNPKDPKSRPTYAKKLYTLNVVSVPLGMRLKHFGNAQEKGDLSKWDIQIELPRKGRSPKLSFQTVGSVITVSNKKSYIIEKIQEVFVTNPATQARENKSSLILYGYDPKTKKKFGEMIIGEIGKDIVDPRKHVTFYFAVDKTELQGFVGDSISIGDERRGIDKFTIESADDVNKTAQLKAESGLKELIPTAPPMSTFENAPSDGFSQEPPPEMSGNRKRRPTPSSAPRRGTGFKGMPGFKTK